MYPSCLPHLAPARAEINPGNLAARGHRTDLGHGADRERAI
ncbi:hypothetical protein MBELCI_2466 [Limimaricola cinnabarinus LL-001]|uniref:Uncharacterized protein n=1 Tax=Limimaricola cinnabarinus LL-001 TaxID=1337093 RepID=U3AFH1_9RHOB|nr:hypothetical protein MBELCI_2466 [Limimaricola cinnabarinus LL-001]